MVDDSTKMALHLMQGMTVQHLLFQVRSQDRIAFDKQPGKALRGALFEVLRANFCGHDWALHLPDHDQYCPVCWLLDREDMEAERGKGVVRPLTIEPPLVNTVFAPGEEWEFGISLIGKARDFLPYVARAVQQMGATGVGKGRGRFRLISLSEWSPLLDVKRRLLNDRVVKKPRLAVTASQIDDIAGEWGGDHVLLHFLTPTRLTADKRLVREPEPKVMIKRLLERCRTLATYYAETDLLPMSEQWKTNYLHLSQLVESIQVSYYEVEWQDVFSGSRRQNRYTPIGGFCGWTQWTGNLTPLLPWLLWGQSLHIGKDAVKGNGWFRVYETPP